MSANVKRIFGLFIMDSSAMLLFAAVTGGLALGVEKAGFDTLGLIKIDKDASDTLRRNRSEWRVINVGAFPMQVNNSVRKIHVLHCFIIYAILSNLHIKLTFFL